MSGGYFDYNYLKMEPYMGQFEDHQVDELFEDMQELARILEWYMSGDIGKDKYHTRLNEFKKKWNIIDK